MADDKNRDNDINGCFALITGASKGLGRAFAVELAKRKKNLLLVALPEDNLPDLCRYLEESYGIKCRYFETDLTSKKNIRKLSEQVLRKFRINILINNAGTGGSKEFHDTRQEYLETLISLNITAMTLLTHQLLDELKSHKQSYILNVSSMASFTPMGYKTVYAASKVFVLYFTRGLAQELRGTNVFTSVVNPGPMKTNIQVTKRIEKQGIFGRIGLLTPEEVAKSSLDKLFKRRGFIIPGWLNHVSWLVMKIVPPKISLPIIAGRVKKEFSPGQINENGKNTGNRS